MSALITYRLRNGAEVLGKLYKGQVDPSRYANHAQAAERARTVGGKVVQFNRAFYVVILSTQEA